MSFIKLWVSFQSLLKGYKSCFANGQGFSSSECQNFLLLILGIIIFMLILYALTRFLGGIGDDLFEKNENKKK